MEMMGLLRNALKMDNLGPGNWLEWMGVVMCVLGWGAEMETSKGSWRFLDCMPRQVTVSSAGAGRGGIPGILLGFM